MPCRGSRALEEIRRLQTLRLARTRCRFLDTWSTARARRRADCGVTGPGFTAGARPAARCTRSSWCARTARASHAWPAGGASKQRNRQRASRASRVAYARDARPSARARFSTQRSLAWRGSHVAGARGEPQRRLADRCTLWCGPTPRACAGRSTDCSTAAETYAAANGSSGAVTSSSRDDGTNCAADPCGTAASGRECCSVARTAACSSGVGASDPAATGRCQAAAGDCRAATAPASRTATGCAATAAATDACGSTAAASAGTSAAGSQAGWETRLRRARTTEVPALMTS